MSDAHWDLDVAPTAQEAYEAMVLAGHSTLRGRKRGLIIFNALFVGLFAPLGATMIVWIMVQMAGGPALGDLPVAVVPLTLLAFGALGIWLMRRMSFIVAQASVESKFGRAQQVKLDAEGITLRTAHSQWHTGWEDVSAVRNGKTCVSVAVSGIAFTLPHRAFANPPDIEQAVQMMLRWQSDAA